MLSVLTGGLCQTRYWEELLLPSLGRAPNGPGGSGRGISAEVTRWLESPCANSGHRTHGRRCPDALTSPPTMARDSRGFTSAIFAELAF